MKKSGEKETVVVTGAGGQLGRAICSRLDNDYEIYRVDVSFSKESETARDFRVDVADQSQVSELFERINPDVVVNNAGVSLFTPLVDRTEEELDHVYQVNLRGTINMTNAFARANKNNSLPKRIVNLGSVYGVVSADPRIYTDCDRNSPEIYAATKAGIIQLTKYYCVHLRDIAIRVNSISPGGIFNPEEPQGEDFVQNYSFRCPMGRMGSPDDIANGVRFLISHESAYINGHNLIIDGGFTSW